VAVSISCSMYIACPLYGRMCESASIWRTVRIEKCFSSSSRVYTVVSGIFSVHRDSRVSICAFFRVDTIYIASWVDTTIGGIFSPFWIRASRISSFLDIYVVFLVVLSSEIYILAYSICIFVENQMKIDFNIQFTINQLQVHTIFYILHTVNNTYIDFRHLTLHPSTLSI
jgi:hypothetical protein